MGRLNEVLNNGQQIIFTPPFYMEEEKVMEVKKLLENNQVAMEEEQKKLWKNYLEQMMGHMEQLILKGEQIVGIETFQAVSKNQQERKEKLATSLSLSAYQEMAKLLLNDYQTYKSKMEQTIALNDFHKKQAQGMNEANLLLTQINEKIGKEETLYDEDFKEMIALYDKISSSSDEKEQLASLYLLLDAAKRVLAKKQESTKKEEIKQVKDFDLFAKINDQIVDHHFVKKENVIYASYTLEDGSTYYAIVPSEEVAFKENESFQNLPSIQMTKSSFESALKLIMNNMVAYYDLNEYTRYIEQSFKKQMTPAIDSALNQYKTRLNEMEKTVKMQMDFMRDLAPVLYGRSSTKYPNITYKDQAPATFFKEENLSGERKHLLLDILINDQVPLKITTSDMLKAIHGEDKVKELMTSSFQAETVKVNTKTVIEKQDPNIKEEQETPLQTNPSKLHEYLKIREQELSLLKTSPNANVNVTLENDSLYKNINTVLNLHMAAAISDQKYQQGQGMFAVNQYLKTGETARFTSNFDARNLASSVDKEEYLKLLLENMVKSFAGSGKKIKEDKTYFDRMQPIFSFIQRELSKEEFDVEKSRELLLNDDNLLNTAVSNFDYDYLDPLSEESKMLDQALDFGKANNNPSAIKIDQALQKIKKFKIAETSINQANASVVKAA